MLVFRLYHQGAVCYGVSKWKTCDRRTNVTDAADLARPFAVDLFGPGTIGVSREFYNSS